jgi:alkanesulfonate monooxygenase SsuD/methylene tetrahydromethanopterin reductase-like flavin-dependent oxidoreductase (luciferase family)
MFAFDSPISLVNCWLDQIRGRVRSRLPRTSTTTPASSAQRVRALLDPQGRGRQFVAARPPLWMMSRDPQTLELRARNAINPGYFLIYPRSDAAPRYRKFLEDWNKAGWLQKPNIAYCTIVHVDETDDKAIKTGLFRASRAYEGFLPPPQPGETFDERVRTHAKKFIGRGEPGASEIMANLFDPDYLMQHELVFIGSPETVAKKIHAAAQSGLFNTFMGEFNFSICRSATSCGRSAYLARR